MKIIATQPNCPSFILAADLDGDSDLNTVAASIASHTIAWYRNVDGLGTFEFANDLGRPLSRPEQLRVADLDGDGRGSFEPVAQQHMGNTDFNAVDLDQDGDLDLLSNWGWLENAGAGGFRPWRFPRESTARWSAAADVDVDADGDLDVLVTGWSSDTVAWFEHRVPGDSNGDSRFDSSDLVFVFQTGEYEDRLAANSSFADGDWDDDDEFSSSDQL